MVGVVLNRVSRKTSNYYGYYRYENDPVYSVEVQAADANANASANGGGRRKGLASMFTGKSVNGQIGEEVIS